MSYFRNNTKIFNFVIKEFLIDNRTDKYYLICEHNQSFVNHGPIFVVD